MPSILGTRL
jgi:hypothetical protein